MVTVLPVIYQLFQQIERSGHSDGNQVIEYDIHTAKEKPLISYFITTICVLVVICGTAIYYFLPLGFISNNMTVWTQHLIHFVDCFLCIHAHPHLVHRGTGSPRASSPPSSISYCPIHLWLVLLQRNSHLLSPFDSKQSQTNPLHSACDSLRILSDPLYLHHCPIPDFSSFHKPQILLWLGHQFHHLSFRHKLRFRSDFENGKRSCAFLPLL